MSRKQPPPRPLRAVVFDFDGTLVTADVLDEMCGLAGQLEASRSINARFIAGELDGIAALSARINMLNGLTLTQVSALLERVGTLTPGASELFTAVRRAGLLTVIASGSILPVLEHYQGMLGADHVLGPLPHVHDGVLAGLDETNAPPLNFKYLWTEQLLSAAGIEWSQVAVVGDSPAERAMWAVCGLAIGIHPKGGIESDVDVLLAGDLRPAIGYILSHGAT